MNDPAHVRTEVSVRRLAFLIAAVKQDPSVAQGITHETRLLDGGVDLDSLSLTELLLKVEDDLGVMIDFGRLDRPHLQTVGSLIGFLTAADE